MVSEVKPRPGLILFLVKATHKNFFEAEFSSLYKNALSRIKDPSIVVPKLFSPLDLSPYYLVDGLDESLAKSITERSIITKASYRLLGTGKTSKDLSLKGFSSTSLEPSDTFCVKIRGFQHKCSQEERLDKIEQVVEDILRIPETNNVKINGADVEYHVLEYFTLGEKPSKAGGDGKISEQELCLLGEVLFENQENVQVELSLKSRNFIGNTSMDPVLATIMANLAFLHPGDLVLDPYCGSGGCLVACGHRKAYCVGLEINYLLVHGRSKPTRAKQKVRQQNESIRSNFEQYNMGERFLDVWVGDASMHSVFKSSPGGLFDAIVTDPPYGIREAGKRVKAAVDLEEFHAKIAKQEAARDADLLTPLPHFASKDKFDNVYADLIELSGKILRKFGRLVFWFATEQRDLTALHALCQPFSDIFSIESASEQVFSKTNIRYLVVLVKR